MKKTSPRFTTGSLVRGVQYASEYIQHSMVGIVICESDRSNWWGDEYIRWYEILAENGKIVEEVEKYLEEVA